MKNTIAAIALALTTLAAPAAEKWVHVLDGEDGTRMIVDVASFARAQGDEGATYIGANFRYVSDGKINPVFIFVTELASCKSGAGELYARVLRDGRWVTRDTYFWSQSGTKLYDHGAQALCTLLSASEEHQRTRTPSTNSKSL